MPNSKMPGFTESLFIHFGRRGGYVGAVGVYAVAVLALAAYVIPPLFK